MTLSRRDFLRASAAGASLAVVPWEARPAAAATDCGALADIEHVVFVMQENRSFDHYFGRYPGVRGFDDPSPAYRQGGYAPFHIDNGDCAYNVGHQWVEQHECWNGGAMDGFVKTHVAEEGATYGPLAMGYYERDDLPYYYALADAFTTCDRYFCSAISGTFANRVIAISGTLDPDGKAGGPVINTPEGGNTQDYAKLYGQLTWKTMPEVLRDHGVSWKFYNPPDSFFPETIDTVLPFFQQFYTDPTLAAPAFASQTTPIDFAADCAADNLPAVSWVSLPFLTSEHPPTPISWGEDFTQRIVTAVMSNPAVWKKTAVFITWDENGGFFDHMPPPVPPPGTPGEYLTAEPNVGSSGGIRGPIGLGFRVPMIVVSPWTRNPRPKSDPAWQPQVCSDVLDHTSQLRFLERWLAAKGTPGVAIPNDTAWRKKTVGDLTGAFSFERAADASVPALPSTSFANALTKPECQQSPLTLSSSIPVDAPNVPKAPDPASTKLPAQEPSPHGVLRPAGVCDTNARAASAAPAPTRVKGEQLANTGRSLRTARNIAAACFAIVLAVRRRQPTNS